MTDLSDPLDQIRAALPGLDVTTPDAPYLQEPRNRYQGRAVGLVRPRSTQDVARIVSWAGTSGQALVPYGGGTGLVAGQVAPEGPPPLLMSLERMNAIRAVYPQEAVLVAEAGAILTTVQDAAADADLLFPLSLGSEGSARIGGLLSTNAGGVNVLRYGNARDLCLGLEAVLPDGSIWNGLKRLRKDNTGYDLRNLLIGAEGTLGIITAASLRLFPRPADRVAAVFTVTGPAAALSLLSIARDQLAEQVSAFELISGAGLRFLSEVLPDLRQPFETPPDWAVLVDLGLSCGTDGDAALAALFEAGMEAGLVEDGVISTSDTQRAQFWSVREHIPEANRLIGAIASHDVSLPLSAIPAFIDRAQSDLADLGDMRVNCFGHLGDGNLHFNVFPARGRTREDYAQLQAPVVRLVHDLVDAYDGSISAEHGIGRLKVADLERYGDPAKLAAMRAIKAALDPKGLMNPGAVLRGLP